MVVMVKTDRDNDLDGGGGNSNDVIVVDENSVFDTKVSDEAEYDDEQTEELLVKLLNVMKVPK